MIFLVFRVKFVPLVVQSMKP